MARKKLPRSSKKGPHNTALAVSSPAPQASTAPQMVATIDPAGPMEQRSVVRVQDGWSEFELDDGSTIRTKLVVVDAKRAAGQFNPANGDPVYILQLAGITNTEAPEHLKKK